MNCSWDGRDGREKSEDGENDIEELHFDWGSQKCNVEYDGRLV
jgi:hypothetical protein